MAAQERMEDAMTASKIMTGLSLVTLMTACSESGTGPTPAPGKQTLNLSVSAGRSGVSAAAPESLTVGGHTLVLNKVELVISEFQLKRVSNSADCSSSGSGSQSGSGGDDTHPDDDCEEVEAGPFLLDLPLGGGVQRVVSVEVDTGTYRRADYKIHKPEDHGADATFLAQHPDLKGVSVRVSGAYDGKSFVYVTDLTASQRNELVPPLVVAAKGATNFTLVVDISKWFVTAGGGLVDPVTALKGSPNDNLVRDNIRRSFRCFNDRDRDGHED